MGGWHVNAQCERYLPHALACVSLLAEVERYRPEMGDLLFKMAYYLFERGRYPEAERLAAQAAMLSEQLHGPDHPDNVPPLLFYAALSWRKGKSDFAERLLDGHWRSVSSIWGQITTRLLAP
ncbi:MAG TPA: tetratricopeptide repeat protein [Ktedonobacterales bacterium]|jgi:hypothetical protein